MLACIELACRNCSEDPFLIAAPTPSCFQMAATLWHARCCMWPSHVEIPLCSDRSASAFDMQEGDELCLETVDLMLTILGAEAGHMGIRLLASGGVYLTGAAALCGISHMLPS